MAGQNITSADAIIELVIAELTRQGLTSSSSKRRTSSKWVIPTRQSTSVR